MQMILAREQVSRLLRAETREGALAAPGSGGFRRAISIGFLPAQNEVACSVATDDMGEVLRGQFPKTFLVVPVAAFLRAIRQGDAPYLLASGSHSMASVPGVGAFLLALAERVLHHHACLFLVRPMDQWELVRSWAVDTAGRLHELGDGKIMGVRMTAGDDAVFWGRGQDGHLYLLPRAEVVRGWFGRRRWHRVSGISGVVSIPHRWTDPHCPIATRDGLAFVDLREIASGRVRITGEQDAHAVRVIGDLLPPRCRAGHGTEPSTVALVEDWEDPDDPAQYVVRVLRPTGKPPVYAACLMGARAEARAYEAKRKARLAAPAT